MTLGYHNLSNKKIQYMILILIKKSGIKELHDTISVGFHYTGVSNKDDLS